MAAIKNGPPGVRAAPHPHRERAEHHACGHGVRVLAVGLRRPGDYALAGAPWDSPPGAPARGNVIVTVVPFPATLASVMVPPHSSTFRFAFTSPRPDPAVLVEKYGSKARRAAAASIPTPVSTTAITTT